VSTVSTNITNVNSVATDIAKVNTVANNIVAVDNVATNAANVTTVAGISSSVASVAANATNVNTVATNINNVNQVGPNITSVNTAATNIAAIIAAPTQATNAANSATSAAASAAAASAASLANEPVRHSVRPSLLLDFANTKQLDPRITFTRGSTASFYDGKTVAKAEENLITNSQTATSTDGAATTNNNATAPNDTTTAASIIETATTGIHATSSNAAPLTAVPFTFSFFAKPNGRNWVALRVAGVTRAWFDITNGVLGTVTAGVTATITSSAQGYYRCAATFTPPAGTANIFVRMGNADNSDSYTGDGVSGINIWGFQVEQRSSVTAYTATTTAPITNYIPALQTAAAGVARFEHNPITGESLGLLIEEQRTNLLTSSEEFNTTWTATRSSVVANAIVAPDGTLTGDKLVEDTTASNTHFVTQTQTATATTTTFSCYAKAGERTQINLHSFESSTPSNPIVAIFNLSSGTVVSTSGNTTSASITPVGNGWYRCVVTGTTALVATTWNIRPAVSGNVTYTGDGYSGLYVWGAQLEAGAFATSYIPTVASQVTRSADLATMTGTNFSSWYRADEGTLYAEGGPVVNEGALFSVHDGTFNNFIAHIFRFGTASRTWTFASGVEQTNISNTVSGNVKHALVYAANNFAQSVNGLAVVTDTTATIPVVNQLNIGLRVTSNNTNGTIRKLAYYPKRLQNSELVGLTTV
jgi:hypothetical protein